MRVRAAVAYEAGKPLVVEEVDLQGPKAFEVLSDILRPSLRDDDFETRLRRVEKVLWVGIGLSASAGSAAGSVRLRTCRSTWLGHQSRLERGRSVAETVGEEIAGFSLSLVLAVVSVPCGLALASLGFGSVSVTGCLSAGVRRCRASSGSSRRGTGPSR